MSKLDDMTKSVLKIARRVIRSIIAAFSMLHVAYMITEAIVNPCVSYVAQGEFYYPFEILQI